MVEIIHLTMGVIMCTANFIGLHWKEEITTLLQAVSWTVSITVHTKGLFPLLDRKYSEWI